MIDVFLHVWKYTLWPSYLAGFIFWGIAFYFLMCLGEYFAHRLFMHSVGEKEIRWWQRINFRRGDHDEHHNEGKNEPLWKHINLSFIDHWLIVSMMGIPFWLSYRLSEGVAWSYGGGFWLVTALWLHSYAYSQIHQATHRLRQTWATCRFKWLHDHHSGHHADTSKNFSVTCRWPDFIFGTWLDLRPWWKFTSTRRKAK